MDNYNWKKEMPQVPENVHNAVTQALDIVLSGQTAEKQQRSGKIRKLKRKMFFPLVAVLCFALGATVVAAVSLCQQRMEEMSREMLEDFYAQAFVGETLHYSRCLTEEEENRYKQLAKEYEENGRFPEENLRYLESYKDYSGKGVALYADRSTIFFPDEGMSDEELLQLIDFEHKLAYSIQTIGTQIVEGEYENKQKLHMPEADGEQVIAYEGSVDVVCMTAGEKCLYLAGTNVIERMEIGESTSKPFYAADFGENMVVYAMEEDMEQGLYVLLLEQGEDNYLGGKILHIGRSGELLYEKSIEKPLVYALAVDQQGRLYAQTSKKIFVYDADGEVLCAVNMPYNTWTRNSMCRGNDGNVYLLCEDSSFHSIIQRIDPDAGEITTVASETIPTGQPHCHAIAKGYGEDFILWDYEGLYTYSLGDSAAQKVMELYEAPLQWEDAMCDTLADGRVVFVKAFENEDNGAGKVVPESVRICYVTIE